jgi:hypothetical protein
MGCRRFVGSLEPSPQPTPEDKMKKSARRTKSKSASKRSRAKSKSSQARKAKNRTRFGLKTVAKKTKKVAQKAVVAAGLAALNTAVDELSPEKKTAR